MAQIPKIIDLKNSYIPMDPRTFPITLHGTQKEDSPTHMSEVIPYDGYNFMPTGYGYKSYFGIGNTLNINALPARCDKIFVFQKETLVSMLVALCEDGIYTKEGQTTGAWTKAVSETLPENGTHYDWSYTVIGDTLFCYRAGSAQVWRISSSNIAYPTMASPTVVAGYLSTYVVPYASGYPAGTRSYSYRTKKATQPWSTKSATVNAVLTVASSVRLELIGIPADIEKIRIYRDVGGVVHYTDWLYDADTALVVDSTLNTVTWTPIAQEDLTDIGAYAPYTWLPLVPTFLNMAGQIGIFRAGQRLGFWDSENSISWSSIDDFGDFTPSIETLAGSAIFGDVTGRVVNILPHGEGFMIYATRSVVNVKQAIDATFQWDPKVVFTANGIAYPEQACMSNPDSTHFAWTSAGLYKIESGEPEVLVPEFYDFMTLEDTPVYLKVLEGRYLFIQPGDADALYGNVEFTINTVPPTVIDFPISDASSVLSDGVHISGNAVCNTYNAYDKDTNQDAALDAAIASAGGQPAKKTNGRPNYQPYYTAYFSHGFAPDVGTITWDSTPCGSSAFDGTPWHMSPNVNTVNELGQGAANKLVMGDSDWIGGAWTIEKFVATQMAIWKAEDANRDQFLAAVTSRAFFDTKDEETATDLTIPDSYSFCGVGTYPKDFDPPYFGMNSCSFWLTRIMRSAVEVTAVTANKINSTYHAAQYNPNQYIWGWWVGGHYQDVGPYIYNIGSRADGIAKVAQAMSGNGGIGSLLSDMWDDWSCYSGDNLMAGVVHAWPGTCATGTPVKGPDGYYCLIPANYSTHKSRGCYNRGETKPMLAVDTAYCVLTGWRYMGTDNAWHTVAATNSCKAPGYTPPNDNSAGNPIYPNAPLGIDGEGTICSIPFSPVTLPGLEYNPVVWPSQSVTIPAGNFLLQNGSAAPIYPVFPGAYVYDLHLKKWGKMKRDYTQLLEYTPINGSYNNPISYDRFGMEAGLLTQEGYIKLFDSAPDVSSIKYGKIGYSRLGFTAAEEFKFQMASECSYSVTIEASIDGKMTETMLSVNETFANSTNGVLYYNNAGRWFTVAFSGQFDLTHLEFRGTIAGRR